MFSIKVLSAIFLLTIVNRFAEAAVISRVDLDMLRTDFDDPIEEISKTSTTIVAASSQKSAILKRNSVNAKTKSNAFATSTTPGTAPTTTTTIAPTTSAPAIIGSFEDPMQISLSTIWAVSYLRAQESCLEYFQWDRWNCLKEDFERRANNQPDDPTREDIYVQGLLAAAFLYTMAQNQSTLTGSVGLYQIKVADEIYRNQLKALPSGLRYRLWRHNYKVVLRILEESLENRCHCLEEFQSIPGECSQRFCQSELPPFEEIGRELRRVYDESIEVEEGERNGRILWRNVPMDSFVYLRKSPSYCEPDSIPNWPGMLGRRCTADLKLNITLKESDHSLCRDLCRKCGYGTRVKRTTVQKKCNCRLTPDFRVQCDICAKERQHLECY